MVRRTLTGTSDLTARSPSVVRTPTAPPTSITKSTRPESPWPSPRFGTMVSPTGRWRTVVRIVRIMALAFLGPVSLIGARYGVRADPLARVSAGEPQSVAHGLGRVVTVGPALGGVIIRAPG